MTPQSIVTVIKMEELLEDYLKNSDHYLSDSPIHSLLDNIIRDGETVYVVRVFNSCCYSGYEEIEISVSDLLVFLYKRGAS